MHGKLGKTMQKSHLIQKEGNSFEFLSSPNFEVSVPIFIVFLSEMRSQVYKTLSGSTSEHFLEVEID